MPPVSVVVRSCDFPNDLLWKSRHPSAPSNQRTSSKSRAHDSLVPIDQLMVLAWRLFLRRIGLCVVLFLISFIVRLALMAPEYFANEMLRAEELKTHDTNSDFLCHFDPALGVRVA